MRAFPCSVWLVLPLLAAAARAQLPAGGLRNLPAQTMVEGCLDLPLSAGVLLRVDQKEARHVPWAPHLREGRLADWDADRLRPAWVVTVPADGFYLVETFLATEGARPCGFALSFLRDGKESRAAGALKPEAGPRQRLGEVRLAAGEYQVVCRPYVWQHPFELVALEGFRLTPRGAPRSDAPLRAPAVAPPPAPDGPPETLFAPGGLEALPPQFQPPLAADLRELPAAAPPAPDPAFAARDEGPALAALLARLRAAIPPGQVGLESFDRHAAAGRPTEALTAYRDAFFARLKRPETFGAQTRNIVKEHLFGRGKGFLLKRPDPEALRRNRAGEAVALHLGAGVALRVGPPGAVAWIPATRPPPEAGYGRNPDGHAFWKTPEGQDLAADIEVRRAMKFLPADSAKFLEGGLFPALLHAYAATGDRAALALWCAYLDDFALRAVDQYARYPVAIRAATELETQQLRVLLMFWRILLDERPEFARDFPPATLARFLLFAVKEYPAYTVRAKRAEQANWGIMGICDLAHLCRFLPEFSVMRRLERETWRLWQANFHQHRTPDGENVEAWDTGHNAVDVEYARFARDLMPPPWAPKAEAADYWDQVRVNQRSLLTHLTPDGQYWSSWLPEGRELDNDVRNRWLREGWLDLVRIEPGARQRIDSVLAGAPGPLGSPRRTDFSPHAAMAYLREGWRAGDAMWYFQNFQTRSQTLWSCGNTAAHLAQNGRTLVEAHPVAVDGKPPNRFWGAVPSGGKTEYGGQAAQGTVGRGFHTAACQFVEGVQTDPYAVPALDERFDVTGLYRSDRNGVDDPAPDRDTRFLRRLFYLEGGLSLVLDTQVGRPTGEREFTQFVTFPTLPVLAKLPERLPEWPADNPLVWVDPALGQAGTRLPGQPNARVRFLGPGQPVFANRLNRRREHETFPRTVRQDLEAALAAKRDAKWIAGNLERRPLSARWRAGADFVSALVVEQLAAGREDSDWRIERLDTPPTEIALRATHADGRVWHLRHRAPGTGAADAPLLDLPGFSVTADQALVLDRPGGAREAWVFSARALRVANRLVALPAPDAVVTVGAGTGPVEARAIPTPLDVVIEHAPPVFTDSAEVRLRATRPDAEIRYTLDGSEPNLSSPPYVGPLRLDRTTRVRARALAPGLAATPWHFDGLESSRTVTALCVREPWRTPDRPLAAAPPAPGLRAEVVAGDWTSVYLLTGEPGQLPPLATGVVRSLFDPAELEALRPGDGAWGLRAEGWLRAPADGLYTFHAPEHLYTTTRDAGYDLRLWVGDTEWEPSPRPHGEGSWGVPLRAGWHRFRLVWADIRERPFRHDFWMPWRAEQMVEGVPALRVEGPGLPPGGGPLPTDWLGHAP
jgi:hypothetical protein